jgi:hypothetical protein
MTLICPKIPFVQIICGSRGSGKTQLLVNMLTDPKMYAKKFSRIIIVSPTLQYDKTWLESSINFEKSNIECFSEFQQSQIDELISEQKLLLINDINSAENSILLILDDCVSNDQTIRRSDNQLKDLAFLGRHLRISTIYTSQRSASINCDITS